MVWDVATLSTTLAANEGYWVYASSTKTYSTELNSSDEASLDLDLIINDPTEADADDANVTDSVNADLGDVLSFPTEDRWSENPLFCYG